MCCNISASLPNYQLSTREKEKEKETQDPQSNKYKNPLTDASIQLIIPLNKANPSGSKDAH